MTSDRLGFAALLLSVALHGGGTAYAAYRCLAPSPARGIVVDVAVLEDPPPPIVAPPNPRADPAPEPPPEPKALKIAAAPVPRPQASEPLPAPPVVAVRPEDTVDRGAEAFTTSDAPIADPSVHGDPHGVVGGVVGGTVGGTGAGSVAAAPLPIIGPSYDAAYLNNTPPRYPPMAKRMKLHGTSMVRVLVGADGRPQTVRIEKSAGVDILDEAALVAVRGWTFVPARQGSVPVAAEVDVPLRFHLEGLETN